MNLSASQTATLDTKLAAHHSALVVGLGVQPTSDRTTSPATELLIAESNSRATTARDRVDCDAANRASAGPHRRDLGRHAIDEICLRQLLQRCLFSPPPGYFFLVRRPPGATAFAACCCLLCANQCIVFHAHHCTAHGQPIGFPLRLLLRRLTDDPRSPIHLKMHLPG